ncbi:nucleoside-diphosphate sugar epimerase/dehydratase [soil metagenome]
MGMPAPASDGNDGRHGDNSKGPTGAPRSGVVTRLASGAAKVRADLPLVAFDALLVAMAYTGVLMLRFDGAVPPRYWHNLVALMPLALAVHLTVNGITGLYGKVWRQAGVQEARHLLIAGATACALLVVYVAPGAHEVPMSVVLLGAAVTLLLTGGVRFYSRLFAFQRGRDADHEPTALVIIGAGNAAGALVREMLSDPTIGLRPVAVIDDDERKQGRRLANVPIIGGLDALPDAVLLHGAQQALLALPSADSGYVRRAADAAREAGLPMKVLPSVVELVGGGVSVRDVRDLSIRDLLGRQQVSTDLDEVHRILAGRRVLITGAGGSIGSEIARQVATFEPAELLLLDHDETHLHDAAAELVRPAVQILADIRDPSRVDRVFREHRPEVVFHAAAHKHVPLLERHPCEAVATNVLGTDNLLRSSVAVGVDRFVAISTDKAVNPSSVMGATKRLSEQLLLSHRPGGARFCAVRFGNVLGSRGSVIPTFMRQIQRGGPVTVTHPDVTRFFMSIPEAVQLVLQAAALSDGGEVFMLEMGEPIRIVDLAERMIHLSGRMDVRVEFTGLRPGEKLNEELRGLDEPSGPTPHPAILSVRPVMVDRERLLPGLHGLRVLTGEQDSRGVFKLLFDLADSTPAPAVSRVYPARATTA